MLLTPLACTSFLVLLFSPPYLPEVAVQALTYDVVVHDRPIGQLNVTKVPTATGVQYRVDANVALQFFGEKHMVTHFTSTYQSNLLTEAQFHDQLNGRTKHDARVRWDGSGYRIRINDAQSVIAGRQATYSAASLYYREPMGVIDLFSERYGRFCSLRTVAPHTYELTLPDGKKNLYRYADGVCREVEVQQPLFTVYFRLRP